MTHVATPPASTRSLAPTAPAAGRAIETITDPRALPALRREWEAISQRCGVTWPTGHPARFDALLESSARSGQPHLVVTRNAGVVTGMVAARQRVDRLVTRLGYWQVPTPRLRCLDVVHGGLIGMEDPTAMSRAGERLLEAVQARRVDLLTVHQAPADHMIISVLARGADRAGLSIQRRTERHGAFELVPGSFDQTLLRGLSRKRRHEVRREHRNLQAAFPGTVRFVELRRPAEVEQALTWAVAISGKTYKQHLGVGIEDSPRWRAILSSAAAEGWLRAWFLLERDQPIAFLLGSVLGDRCYLESMGFLPAYARHSPGKNALFRMIERLCEEGVRWVDYGIGDAGYKRVFGTTWDDLVTLRVYARTNTARAARCVAAVVASAHGAGAGMAHRLGGANRLRRWWRRRLARSTKGGSTS
ncbi:MAG: GNAT family N-acetyltransferase [Planctomycetota bacterium]|jgi:CelD/BcsL family acetyltransferase involved in cellulose biosynthesis